MEPDLSVLMTEIESELSPTPFSSVLFDKAFASLDERYQRILIMRYDRKLSLAEIGYYEKVSYQRIHQLLTYSKRLIVEDLETYTN